MRYNVFMYPQVRIPLALIFVFLSLFPLLFSGCAGGGPPPAPLWDPALYDTVAVLPVRMTILTGREYFKSEDTEVSNTMGGLMQEGLSVVMRHRGYQVLAPGDLSERLMDEDDLSEAFAVLAAAHGYMGKEGAVPWGEAVEEASLLGEKLGADLLVLAHGRGEYHSFKENLFQGLVTGFLSRGREQYQAPPSFLEVDVFFVDPAAGVRLARIRPRHMPYEDEPIPLAKTLNRYLGRVPIKQDTEDGMQGVEELPKP